MPSDVILIMILYTQCCKPLLLLQIEKPYSLKYSSNIKVHYETNKEQFFWIAKKILKKNTEAIIQSNLPREQAFSLVYTQSMLKSQRFCD